MNHFQTPIEPKELTHYTQEYSIASLSEVYICFTVQDTLTIEGFKFEFEYESPSKKVETLGGLVLVSDQRLEKAGLWEIVARQFNVHAQSYIPICPGVPLAFLQSFEPIIANIGGSVFLQLLNNSPESVKIKITPIGFTFDEWMELQNKASE